MNKEFVPYEEALALREVGFDEPCIGCYTKLTAEENQGEPVDWLEVSEALIENGKYSYGKLKNYNTDFYKSEGTISAPLYQQAFRWFRKKGIYGDLTSDLSDNLEDRVFVYYIYSETRCYFVDRSKEYKTYEMAELACLKELIEIVKQRV
jgi:hypothetical protein